MARPKATNCTISTYIRKDKNSLNGKLGVRWSFAGMKIRIPTFFEAAEADLDVAGYIKRNRRTDADSINQYLQLVRERLQLAHDLLAQQGLDKISETAMQAEYDRLKKEYEDQLDAEQKAALAEERKKKNRKNSFEIIAYWSKEEFIPTAQQEIEALEAQLASKKKELTNYQKLANTYQDDRLVTFLTMYQTRKGKQTLAESTLRTNMAFINTVRHFDAEVKISEVDDAWLYRFQDWLIDTPYQVPVIQYKFVNGKQTVDKVTGYKDGPPRKNSTIQSYCQKIKSCLDYYREYSELLPPDTTIGTRYQRWKFELANKEDNVIAIEEWELQLIVDLLRSGRLQPKKKSHLKALHVFCFLCSTGLRLVDVFKINRACIIKDADNKPMISKVVQKTKRYTLEANIPLNPISTYILSLYNYDMDNAKMEDYYFRDMIKEALDNPALLPTFQDREKLISFSGANEIVKTVSKDKKEAAYEKLHGVRRCELIGSHSGRRTFINILLDNNVPLNKIMAQTAHSTIENLMVYANKRKNLSRYTTNVFQLPQYEVQDYNLPEFKPAETVEATAALV